MFTAHLPKQPYFRKDHSLDLPKARQALLAELNRLFSEVRDYNGGLLSKQLETFQHLKDLLGSDALKNGFLLENFFFSLTPSIAQTSANPRLLKEGFRMLLEQIRGSCPVGVHRSESGVAACFVQSSAEEKDRFVTLLQTAKDSYDRICHSSVLIHDLYYLTVFFSSGDPRKLTECESFLKSYLSKPFELEAKGDYPFALAGSADAGVTSMVV